MDFFSKWSDALTGVLNQTIERVSLYLPNVLGAFLLLFVGWIIAHLLRAAAVRMILMGERALARISVGRDTLVARLPGTSVKMFGNVIFWGVVLFFLTAATQVLGLNSFAVWLTRIVDYLPTVFVGVLIIVAGFLLSRLAREVTQATAGAGKRQSVLIGRIVQVGILVTAVLVGAEQMGIKVTFLVVLAAVIGISLVGAVAIALSLGSREYVANLIGAHYLRQRYSVGQQIRLAGYEGRILEFTETALVLETADGRTSLPAKIFNEQAIVLVKGG